MLYRSTLNANVNHSQLEILKAMYAQLSTQYGILVETKAGKPHTDTDMSELTGRLRGAQEEQANLLHKLSTQKEKYRARVT